jgi:hypothetical protein
MTVADRQFAEPMTAIEMTDQIVRRSCPKKAHLGKPVVKLNCSPVPADKRHRALGWLILRPVSSRLLTGSRSTFDCARSGIHDADQGKNTHR